MTAVAPAGRRTPEHGIALGGALAIGFVLRASQMGTLAIVAAYLLDQEVPIELVGLVMVASALGGAVSSVVAGRLIDVHGAWRMLVAGCAAGSAGMLLFARAGSWPVLAAANFVTAVGVSAAANALRTSIGLTVPAERHERAYGRLTSASTAGGVFGPVGMGILILQGTGAAPWFAVVALAAAAGIGIAARRPVTAGAAMPQDDAPQDDAPQDGAEGDPARLPAVSVARAVAPVVALVTTTATMYGVYAVAWSVYLRELGASDSVIAWSFAATFVPVVLLSGRADKVFPSVPRWLVIGVATLSLGLLAFVYAALTSLWVAILVSAVEGVLMAVSIPLTYALIARTAPPQGVGRAFGIAGAADSISSGIGTAIAGTLVALGGVAFSFQIAGAYCVLGAVAGLVWWRVARRPVAG